MRILPDKFDDDDDDQPGFGDPAETSHGSSLPCFQKRRIFQ